MIVSLCLPPGFCTIPLIIEYTCLFLRDLEDGEFFF
jgi:hypothetical protein